MSGNALSVNEFVDASKVLLDLSIDNDNLPGELARQPGLMYYYVARFAEAERQHSEFKLRLEATEAKVASNVRSDALAAGEKLTADMVKERVRLHPQVVKVEQHLIHAKQVETMIKGVCEGMRHRRDSLSGLSFNERDERKARLALDEGMSASVAQRDRAIKDRMASRES